MGNRIDIDYDLIIEKYIELKNLKKVAKFFINTLGLKNMISKLFIYHPPKPLYKFTAKGSVLNIEFQK